MKPFAIRKIGPLWRCEHRTIGWLYGMGNTPTGAFAAMERRYHAYMKNRGEA